MGPAGRVDGAGRGGRNETWMAEGSVNMNTGERMTGGSRGAVEATPAGKVRLYEVAKDLGVSNKDLLEKVRALGIEVKNHMSNLDADDVQRVRRSLDKQRQSNLVEERLSSTVIRRRTRDGAPLRPTAPATDTARPPVSAGPPVAVRPTVETRAPEPPRATPPAVETRATEAPRRIVETPPVETPTPRRVVIENPRSAPVPVETRGPVAPPVATPTPATTPPSAS